MESRLVALQAREVCLSQPLDVLEACEELFRNLRGPSIGAQFCHAPRLPCHADGTLADMTEDHLQIRLFPPHVLSCLVLGTLDISSFSGKNRPNLTKSRVR